MSIDADAMEPSGEERDSGPLAVATVEPDWIGIKTSYCGSELTVAQICAVFCISPDQLYRRRRAEGWPLRSEMAKRSESERRAAGAETIGTETNEAEARTPRAVRNTVVPKTPAALQRWRRDMIGRLYAAMECQLSHIERQQEAATPISGAERERQTRQMNVMTRSMEKFPHALGYFHYGARHGVADCWTVCGSGHQCCDD